MTELAIYDMDRTITRLGTYTPWLLYWAWRKAPWRLVFVPLALLFGILYVCKLISRGRLKEWNQRFLMGGRVAQTAVDAVAMSFARRVIAQGTYAEAIAQITSDRLSGKRVVLATASYEFYVQAIAGELGVSDVVATRSKRDSKGRILARIDGENCYGPGKLRMVEAWCADQGLERSQCHVRFYSDHHSDLPVFDWADERVCVHASDRLAHAGRSQGWQLVDWH